MKDVYVRTAVGGPLDGMDVEARFPHGFILVDKPSNQCWIYKVSQDETQWVITPDEDTGNEARAWDSAKSREAANGSDYDVRVLHDN